jgi:hypothetical protein
VTTVNGCQARWATMGETKGRLMQTRIRELPGPAVAAGGLAVLGCMTLRQLGIEFERAWMRSYDGPLLGELPTGHEDPKRSPHASDADETVSERRRWVSPHEPRIALHTARTARSRGR